MFPSLSVLPPLPDVSSPSGTPYRPPGPPTSSLSASSLRALISPLFLVCPLPNLPLYSYLPPLSLSPVRLSSVLLAAIFSNNVCRAYKTFIMGHKTRLSRRLSKVEGSRNVTGAADETSGLNSLREGAGSGERAAVARHPPEGLEGHV